MTEMVKTLQVEEFKKQRNFKKKLKLKIFNFCGGVTHRIRFSASDTAYSCRRALRVNFFTLRGLVFID